MSPRIWWCNQGESWENESPKGIVCSSDDARKLTFRETVGQVKKGDISVHYVSKYKSILALSQAAEDGKACVAGIYGKGWTFHANYFVLKTPILRDLVNSDIFALGLKNSPIIKNGRVRQAYLIPFSVEGLRIIKDVSTDAWPTWALE